jgi:hypothetical protein
VSRLSQVIFATMGLFVFSTLNWLVWGLATPGDYFANGSTLLMVTSLLLGGLGVFVGARLRGRKWKILMLVGTVTCLLFWGLASNGWWAHPPPPANPQGSESSQGRNSGRELVKVAWRR